MAWEQQLTRRNVSRKMADRRRIFFSQEMEGGRGQGERKTLSMLMRVICSVDMPRFSEAGGVNESGVRQG